MALMGFREPNQIKWVGTRPAHNGEQVLLSTNVNNGLGILYTVPVGKVFYWSHYTFDYFATGAGGTVELSIYDAVPAIWKRIHRVNPQVADEKLLTGDFWPPIELSESYSIRIWSSVVTATIYASIHGWVE